MKEFLMSGYHQSIIYSLVATVQAILLIPESLPVIAGMTTLVQIVG
jgi:hypothetical protein